MHLSLPQEVGEPTLLSSLLTWDLGLAVSKLGKSWPS